MILEHVNTDSIGDSTGKRCPLTNNEISQDLQTADLSGFLAHQELRTLAK